MVKVTGQIFSKMSKKKKKIWIGHISEAISPTEFLLGTKVQPNKMDSMTQVTMIELHTSRSSILQNG